MKRKIFGVVLLAIVALLFIESKVFASSESGGLVIGETLDKKRSGKVGYTTAGYYIFTEPLQPGDQFSWAGGYAKDLNPRTAKSYYPLLIGVNNDYSNDKIAIRQEQTGSNPVEGWYQYRYYLNDNGAANLVDKLNPGKPKVDAQGKKYYQFYASTIFSLDPYDLIEPAYRNKAKTISVGSKTYGGSKTRLKLGSKTAVGYFYTLKQISQALSWAAGNDFSDNFKFSLKYYPQTYKSYIRYETPNGKVLKGISGTYTMSTGIGYSQLDSGVYSEKLQIKNGAVPKTPTSADGKKSYYLKQVYYTKTMPESSSAERWKHRTLEEVSGDYKEFSDGSSAPNSDPNTSEYNDWYNGIVDTYYQIAKEKKDDDVSNTATTLYCIYAEIPEIIIPDDTEDKHSMTVPLADPNATVLIAADIKGAEKFSVEAGIPSSEKVYGNLRANAVLYDYKTIKVSGTKYYPVSVTVNWTNVWTTTSSYTTRNADGTYTTHYTTNQHSNPGSMTLNYSIARKYAYRYVDYYDVYEPYQSILNNKSLTGDSMLLSYSKFNSTVNTYVNNAPYLEPDSSVCPNPSTTVSLGTIYSSVPPTITASDYQSTAEALVGTITVQNDKLIINGHTVLEDNLYETSTTATKNIPSSQLITDGTFYKSGVVIPATKANGYYESEGKLTYKSVSKKSSNPDTLEYDLDVNGIKVHTPVVCSPTISNNKVNNQKIDLVDVDYAVLDTNFTVYFPTVGTHLNITGYQTRDYNVYTNARQVKFPFDVMDTKNSGYHPADTWITLTAPSGTTGAQSFYLPPWVAEGVYNIEFRAVSINATANNGIDAAEDGANYSEDSYVAYSNVPLYVTGRMFGFTVYDVSDYPTWQKVFRKPDSLESTGFGYKVGTFDLNGTTTGSNSKYTLPFIDGKHSTLKNVGSIKPGYYFRYYLYTLGSMKDSNDSIEIKPTFYYVNKNGTGKTKVDLYYNETINGKYQKLVKVGSSVDNSNKKKLKLGYDMLAVPYSEIKTTADILGKSVNAVKGTNHKVWTFGRISLDSTLKTFSSQFTGTKPSAVSSALVESSYQKWYGEYYLPSYIYAVDKDFDVMAYGKKYGIDYKESFWKRDGYIIVNFEIISVNDGEANLSYTNPSNASSGYCNMWNTEGFVKTQTDYNGKTFSFYDGDVVLYKLKGIGGGRGSAAEDYTSGGTH